jgi:hypothetical protein
MRFLRSMGVVVAIAVLSFVFVPKAGANNTDQKTVLTFNQAVEVPGTVLPSGTYVFKIVTGKREVVQVLNRDETRVYATFITLSERTDKPFAKPIIRFAERPAGSPKAISAWFYPGRRDGHEFVYPHESTPELAAKANF